VMASDQAEGEKKVIRAGCGLRERRLTLERAPRLICDVIDDAVCHVEGAKTSAGPVLPRRHPAQELQTPGAVVSVWGSETAEKDKYVPFFAQKSINFDGQLSRMKHRLGIMSHRGHKPEQPNQDEFFVLARADSVLLGVLDGHGPDGHDVAHFAQEHLPTHVMEDLRKDRESWQPAVTAAVTRLCKEAKEDPEMCKKSENSGCTITLLLLDRPDAAGNKLRVRCAHLGDSIAVVASRKSKEDSWTVTQLTDIHRPDRKDEMIRIQKAGGTVIMEEDGSSGRLAADGWTLAMSRCFGDFHAHVHGLSCEPEFAADVELDVDHENLILVCSDGVWDVMPPAQAVHIVGKFKPDEAQSAVEKLVSKAQLRWQECSDVVDDITAVLLWPVFGEGLGAVKEDHSEDAEEKVEAP